MTLKSSASGSGSGVSQYAALTDDPRDDAALATYLDAKADSLQPEGTIASAATTSIGGVASEQISVTGTTTITSFGTIAAGTRRILRFGGILSITYNATSMILPGTASITTAVNDRAMFLSLGSGNWICLWYQRANGQFVVPSVNSGQAQDVTAVTYNVDGSVATYTMNGYTWTMAYNANGTPNTETSGSLVKTYGYNGSGQFTGITGAINAGQTKICTFATLPTAANSAPGDLVFVTDTASRVVGSTDSGNMGQLYQFVGATGTGRYGPTGSYSLTRRTGSIATPLGTQSNVLGTIQQIPVAGAAAQAIPAAALLAGKRFRFTAHVHRTGAIAAANIIVKVGQANTSSDTTVTTVTLSGTNNASCRNSFDIFISSSTTASTTNVMNSGTTAADGGSGMTELTGLNLANPLYITLWVSAVSSGDAYQSMYYDIEEIA